MKHLNQATVSLLLFLLLGACATHAVTVEHISAQIHEQGARNYLNDTINNHELWFTHIETLQQGLNKGDEEALKAMGHLRSVSDAGASETLDFMIARAIPHNARIVSASVKQGFKLEAICNIPFIEEEPAVVYEYLRKAKAALKRQESLGDHLAGECFNLLHSRTRP